MTSTSEAYWSIISAFMVACLFVGIVCIDVGHYIYFVNVLHSGARPLADDGSCSHVFIYHAKPYGMFPFGSCSFTKLATAVLFAPLYVLSIIGAGRYVARCATKRLPFNENAYYRSVFLGALPLLLLMPILFLLGEMNGFLTAHFNSFGIDFVLLNVYTVFPTSYIMLLLTKFALSRTNFPLIVATSKGAN